MFKLVVGPTVKEKGRERKKHAKRKKNQKKTKNQKKKTKKKEFCVFNSMIMILSEVTVSDKT